MNMSLKNIFLTSFLALIALDSGTSAIEIIEANIVHVGCFTENINATEFAYKSPYEARGISVNACVEECKEKRFTYAGLHSGTVCLCGDSFSGSPSELCTRNCSANATQACGGDEAVSVYETSHGKLAAPRSLKHVGSEATTLHLSWEHPLGSTADIKHYFVEAVPTFTYDEKDPPRPMQWEYSSHTTSARLEGVHPGTKYLVQVFAESDSGRGYPAVAEIWSGVGAPEVPNTPEMESRTPTAISVRLQSVMPTKGPVSAYQIIVVDESVPVLLQESELTDFKTSEANGLPYYITAQFYADNFVNMFTVGDGKTYGNYFNAPLKEGVDYHILLGVLSTINDTTKASYSPSEHSQHDSIPLDNGPFHTLSDNRRKTASTKPTVSSLFLALSIAIGVISLLLVLSVVLYIILRIVIRKNHQRLSENQELAVHIQHQNQDIENGYAVGAHYIDDELDGVDHYRQLKERVYVIPHQGLNIIGDVGLGKFGDMRKGVMTIGGHQSNVLVHRIADDTLDEVRKRQMLREFDAHIRIGSHDNVLTVLGLLEELNVISVAFEYETATLKTLMVESRAVQHYPVYAEKHRRFSTLPEAQILEMLVGASKGMAHLAYLGITHGQLCARNISIVDGTKPKITGFGLLHYHNDLYVPDYQRWHAIETLKSKTVIPKSDIWSFGCLMWEAVTLGGTPFADVRSEDVSGKVTRGLRLAQPQYVTDDVYQLMLNCWQGDPSERPNFRELQRLLEDIVNDDVTPHLLFALYPTFQYEPYIPSLEFVD